MLPNMDEDEQIWKKTNIEAVLNYRALPVIALQFASPAFPKCPANPNCI